MLVHTQRQHHAHSLVVPLDLLALVLVMAAHRHFHSDATILGSMADYSLRGAHCSSIIVKNRKPPAKVHTFLACVDGSNRAHEGMEIAMSLAKKGDQVIVLHVEEEPLEDCKRRSLALPGCRVIWWLASPPPLTEFHLRALALQ